MQIYLGRSHETSYIAGSSLTYCTQTRELIYPSCGIVYLRNLTFCIKCSCSKFFFQWIGNNQSSPVFWMAAICVCNWKLAGKALCSCRSSDALLWYANSYLWFVRETKAGDGHFFSILDSKWGHLALEKKLWFGESSDSTLFILVGFFFKLKGLELGNVWIPFSPFPNSSLTEDCPIISMQLPQRALCLYFKWA